MIFVTLGSQKFPMDRLLKELDRLVGLKKLAEEVFAQTGHSQYRPVHFSSVQFLDHEDFDRYVEKCDLLITHGGSGAIMSGLKRKKRVIAVPRLKIFGEHVDNHQQELAGVLSEKRYLIMVEDMGMLADAINKARSTEFKLYESSTNLMVDIIQSYLQSS